MSKSLQVDWLLAEIHRLLPFPSTWLPPQAYWVGGSLRDSCLRQLGLAQSTPALGSLAAEEEAVDLDLMITPDPQAGPSPVEWAAGVARQLRAGFVVLDPERQIARLVLPRLTVDVAQQVGATPEADLKQRDFTVNALALDLHGGNLLDPTGGLEDLQQGRIRMVHPDNLSADPIRLLRAYRQAAQLGFVLDPLTAAAIRERAPLVAQVAAERVRGELVALLEAGIPGVEHLQAATAAGLLRNWIPHLQPESRGFIQAKQVWQWVQQWTSYPHLQQELQHPLADRRPCLLTVVLAALLWDPAGPKTIQADLERLCFSRAEQRTVQKLHQLLPLFQDLLEGSPTPVQQWRLYQQAGSLFGGLALLALATGCNWQKVEPWLQRYEDPTDPLAHLVPLLDGHDILQSLQAKPGPWVGQLLIALQEAQASGQVQTRAEALRFIQQWKHRLDTRPTSVQPAQ